MLDGVGGVEGEVVRGTEMYWGRKAQTGGGEMKKGEEGINKATWKCGIELKKKSIHPGGETDRNTNQKLHHLPITIDGFYSPFSPMGHA